MTDEKLSLGALKAMIEGLEEKLKAQPAAPRSGALCAAAAKQEAWLNEYVEIKLFRDGGKYKDDYVVGVNGTLVKIKRGEWVKIRRKYALVIEQSEIQDLKTAQYMEEESNKFAAESKNRGL